MTAIVLLCLLVAQARPGPTAAAQVTRSGLHWVPHYCCPAGQAGLSSAAGSGTRQTAPGDNSALLYLLYRAPDRGGPGGPRPLLLSAGLLPDGHRGEGVPGV